LFLAIEPSFDAGLERLEIGFVAGCRFSVFPFLVEIAHLNV
jgi:hypothetical protein